MSDRDDISGEVPSGPVGNRLDLEQVGAALDPYRGAQDDPTPRPGGWLASVAVVLRPAPSGGGPQLLLIRRSQSEGDPWSGHMAFPGGRKEPSDPSLLSTAIRETQEEVGLALEGLGEPLGRLGTVRPMSAKLPRFTILPFVFSVPAPVQARVASHEVAEVRWVSFSHLLDKRNQVTVIFNEHESRFCFPAIDIEGHRIWGLTHQILADLLRRLGHHPPTAE